MMIYKKQKIRQFILLIGFLTTMTTSCSAAIVSGDNYLISNQQFSFQSPEELNEKNAINLWATYYYLPQFKDGSGDYPLRDMDGNELGPSLSLKEWCHSALEGSVRILNPNGEYETFNYTGTTEQYQVDCQSEFRFNVGKTKFKKTLSPFGEGIKNYILVPYRTIATDPNIIPTGSIVYIPEARGAIIELSNGEKITHDGYFFAGDIGGAIKQNHIDVFLGIHKESPFFPWIGNNAAKTFKAYIVKDEKIIEQLNSIHQKSIQ